jgi:protein-S-isoprenylcysteine O-methyltransferase Ste14
MDLLVLRTNPGLMAERLSPPGDAKTWDRIILSALRLLQLARYIFAGLDQRFSWTKGIPPEAQIGALIVCVLGYALLLWAMGSNNFFSQIVRIQSDRGHAVATHGPYRYVRHPAYVGMILFELAMPILLASWAALIVSGVVRPPAGSAHHPGRPRITNGIIRLCNLCPAGALPAFTGRMVIAILPLKVKSKSGPWSAF